MFTYFTDRDGKYQLKSLAESSFDPLARTCQFMLTEEAHHMFVGETGIGRVVKRCIELMKELGSEDPEAIRAAGAIDLPTIQRYLNFWFSSSLDLFGADTSSNAAAYFANGIKGRPDEGQYADHRELASTYDLEIPDGAGGVLAQGVPMRNAMNEVMRNSYVKDCEIGLTRWNRAIAKAGFSGNLTLPSTRFRRTIGSWANVPTDLRGTIIPQAQFEARKDEFLPTAADRAFVASLMQPVTEPGKMAGWIAPPDRGINSNALEYEYVRLA
jgi:benzoyl-CoA 2,3-dioxygenase component B